MESNKELIMDAKVAIKGYDFITINTLKLKLHKGIVTCNLILDELVAIGVVEEFDMKNGLYKVLI